MVKDILYNTLLFDFYASLLTKKQLNFFDMYYLQDFSINEIACQHKITPQAVHDTIKRTEKLLINYEKKLLLVESHLSKERVLKELCSKINILDIPNTDKENILNLIMCI